MQDQRYGSLDRRPTICLLVDVANIPEDAIAPLVQELRRRGTLAAMFGFGDWHRRDMHLRHRLMDALGFLCIHGGSWENGSGGLKSMVDSIMKRAIKWMPQWFPTCDTYVLATGDRDFSHDASDLRWRGFQVWIAAGEASINNELRLGADEFISLDRLPGHVTPAALLGVPAGYYEQSFGPRRPFRNPPPAAVIETAPPRVVSPAPRPAIAPPRSEPPPAPAPRPIPAPVTPSPAVMSVVTVPAAAPAADAEDRALLDQLRELAGPRGYVIQREALRELAPDDDPGGRVRSRLSNQMRDLVERNLLVRDHVMIGGNLTQVLTLPGTAGVVDGAAEATADGEPAGVRRGRRRLRRGRSGADSVAAGAPPTMDTMDIDEVGAEAPVAAEPVAIAELVEEPVPEENEPVVVAPPRWREAPAPVAVVPAVVAPSPAEPVAAPPIERVSQPAAALTSPAATPAAVEPTLAEAAPAEPTSLPARMPSSLPSERRAAPAQPTARRVETPSARPEEASTPTPAPARPSWREQVAAALAQVRGELDGRAAAPIAPTPVTTPPVVEAPVAVPSEPPVTVPELAPTIAEAVPVVPAVDEAVTDGTDGEAAADAPPARRRRRRRPATAAPVDGSDTAAGDNGTALEAVAAEVAPPSEPAQATEGDDAPETATTGDEPARRRPARRRRRPAAPSDAPAAPAEV